MKPIAQKVVDAGLVPKHTLLLFKRWGYMDPEQTEVPDTALAKHKELEEGFTQFVEELDTLLEEKQDEEIKETRFSITLGDPFQVRWLYEEDQCYLETQDAPFIVFHDETGRLIFPTQFDPTDRYFVAVAKDDRFHVTDCVPLWHGDTLYAYQVEVEPF